MDIALFYASQHCLAVLFASSNFRWVPLNATGAKGGNVVCTEAPSNDKQARCLKVRTEGRQRLSLGQPVIAVGSTMQ